MKGPAGEQFSVVKFTGRAKDVLKKSMLVYGAVSTAFPETNPYVWGGYNDICAAQINPTTTQAPTRRRRPSYGTNWRRY